MARYQNSVNLDDTGVTPGSYTSANIVVNSKGQILAASDGDGGGGPSGSLDDLVDVDVAGATAGQVLTFDGALWEANDFSLNVLTDVSLSTPQTNNILYYNGSTWINGTASQASLVSAGAIGTTVQGYDANLQAISDISGQPGFITFNGATIGKVVMAPAANGGIAITNADGALSPVQFSINFNNLPYNSALSADDLVLTFDNSANAPNKTSIADLVVAGGAITDGVNLGSGADVFVIAQNGVAQYRGILSGSPSVVITTDADDIMVGLTNSLDSLALLTPSSGNFIVGNGTQWTSRTVVEVKTQLAYGSMADEDAGDYLAKAGGVMTGSINMGNQSITNLLGPTNNGDAATKGYVDAQVSAGVIAGAGLTKTGTTIDVIATDSSITVSPDSIALNTAFTDTLYNTKALLQSAVLNSEGALLVGTSVKAGLGNADNVEEALIFLNNYFANSLPKFRIDLTSIWNRDIGAPNVNRGAIRDSEVAIFESTDDSAIYADFIIPPDVDVTLPMTMYINVAKNTSDTGGVMFGLAYQYQRPNVAPANYPSRGPAPNWDFTANVTQTFSNADDLLHTMSWTIAGNTFQPLDTVTIRLSRLANDVGDTYNGDVNLFTTLISQ